MAYTFTALVLGLVNGLDAAPLALVVGVDVVLLLALAVADESRGMPETRVMKLTLDRAFRQIRGHPVRAVRALDGGVSGDAEPQLAAVE